jgi:DNA-binding NarL/FixJ family response regulator
LTPQSQQLKAEAVRLASLTQREDDVSLLVAQGLTNKQIGEQLFISPTTVRHHLSAIFRKLKISSRFQLIALYYRHELVVVPIPPGVAATQASNGNT